MELDIKKLKKYTTDFDDYIAECEKDPRFKKGLDLAIRRLEISHEIMKAREKANLTQKQLAKELKTSQSFVARLENANQNITLDVLMRVADVLSKKIGKPIKFQIRGLVS